MENLKQKYLQIIYGKKESYNDDEFQVVDNLIDTHRKYIKENLFTEAQVLEIKQKYIPYNYSAKKLSKEYNVSESCITHILNNTSWKEISIK